MCGGDAALCQITLTTCYYYYNSATLHAIIWLLHYDGTHIEALFFYLVSKSPMQEKNEPSELGKYI